MSSIVYYKFKCEKEFSALRILGRHVSVRSLKAMIFESKRYGRGKDIDLIISNAQTNEEYTDEDAKIARFTSVLVRRVPAQPRLRVRPHPEELISVDDNKPKIISEAPDFSAEGPYPEESDLSDFGEDPLAMWGMPEGQAAEPFKPANFSSSGQVDGEDQKETSSSASSISQNGGPSSRGYGSIMGGLGFGRGSYEYREPPPGYVCHRCNQPGHFIQHCYTNGDPAYDRKRLKRPTGIPNSMLIPAPNGSYTLPGGGGVAVLQPNEAAFEKAIEGIPTLVRAAAVSTKFLPEDLRCPICKEIMKDSVLNKCCFDSFCDKCIRNHIGNEQKCVCGSLNVQASVLIPNMAVRRLVKEMLESAATSSQVQDASSSNSAVSCLSMETKGPADVHECCREGARERWEDPTGITKQVTTFALICFFLDSCMFILVIVPVFLCNLIMFACEPVMIEMGFQANCSCAVLQVPVEENLFCILFNHSVFVQNFFIQYMMYFELWLQGSNLIYCCKNLLCIL